MRLFLCLSHILFGRYCQKSVAKSGGLGKKKQREDGHIGDGVQTYTLWTLSLSVRELFCENSFLQKSSIIDV